MYKLFAQFFIVGTCVLICFTAAEFSMKGNVKKRNTVIRADNNLPSTCYNSTVIKNVDSLKRVVFASKFIFTGKISSVQIRKRGAEKSRRIIFKVYVRRVLKGDISALSDLLNVVTRKNNSSSRASLLVEGGLRNNVCSTVNRKPAILFSERLSSPLKLLIDPVPLSVDRVRRVKTLIQGKVSENLFYSLLDRVVQPLLELQRVLFCLMYLTYCGYSDKFS
ncbi:jg15372 [Pararge aegeria aegeria]|uniref:Jg15372 protein n=1 Tax=Pararge aegeria aegeria TaxID=348720 RepID=A0A8S4SAH6_9NEOP|nr:jg15372 [Pararge aegeria aegeria]